MAWNEYLDLFFDTQKKKCPFRAFCFDVVDSKNQMKHNNYKNHYQFVCYVYSLLKLEEKLKNKQISMILDMKPALTVEKLNQRIQRDFEKFTRKQFKNTLNDLLPSKMIPEVIRLSKINPEKQVDQITKEERENLVKSLKQFKMTIKKFRPIEEAIVTAGGINIKEINSKTMESKIISGLYFAGEIIDVDAYTGGFNLQIAFSTGYAAGLLE